MRNIVWSLDFAEQVGHADTAAAVDDALAPIMDALMRNPYGFSRFENDFTSFRYARTHAVPGRIAP